MWRLAELSQIVLRPGTGSLDLIRSARSLALDADGSQLLAADYDAVGTVQAISLPSGEHKAMAMNAQLESGCEVFGAGGISPPLKPVGLMTLSTDGRSLAFSQGTDCVVVRDLQTMKTQAILHEYATTLAFRPDGLLMVVSTPRYVPVAQRVPGPDRRRCVSGIGDTASSAGRCRCRSSDPIRSLDTGGSQ